MKSNRRVSVNTYQPTQVERFDDQFWPVVMAICITATVLAATLMTLLAGFWMWLSLMILPGAIAVLVLVLRFVDSRRIKRSIQMAVILSLAAHCVLLIIAKRTDVFAGLLDEKEKTTDPIRKARTVQITTPVQNQPWQIDNVVPAPKPEPTAPSKKPRSTRSATRPSVATNSSPQPIDNSAPQRRTKPTKTVPRLGKNQSTPGRRGTASRKQARRPDSTKPVIRQPDDFLVSKPNTNPSAASARDARFDADRPNITRSTDRSDRQSAVRKSAPDKSVTSPTKDRTVARSRSARSSESRSNPASRRANNSTARRRPQATGPSIANDVPRQILNAPAAATKPDSVAQKQIPVDRADARPRLTSNPGSSFSGPDRPSTTTSTAPTRASQMPIRRSASLPAASTSVTARQPSNAPARTVKSADVPRTATSNPDIRPTNQPSNRASRSVSSAQLRPQPQALQRSQRGNSGIGRSVNTGRQSGARQSSALVASDSARRSETSTQKLDLNSLTLRQRARVPRDLAASEIPKVVDRGDAIPVATRPASQATAELTISASASVSQSNADASVRETSVAKSSGKIDMGTRKIVNDSSPGRVEGGGQKSIQPELSRQPTNARRVTSNAVPGLATEEMVQASDNPLVGQPATRTAKLTERPLPESLDKVLSNPGKRDSLSENQGVQKAVTNQPDSVVASAVVANPERSSNANNVGAMADNDDEDEEEKWRHLALEQSMAKTGRRPDRGQQPTIDAASDIPTISGSPEQSTEQHRATIGDSALASGDPGPPENRVANRANGGATRNRNRQGSAQASNQSNETLNSTTERFNPSDLANNTMANNLTLRQTQAQASRANRSNNETPAIGSGELPPTTQRITNQTGQPSNNRVADSATQDQVTRNREIGVANRIDRPPLSAGIGHRQAEQPGIDSRRASRDSLSIQDRPRTRFRQTDVSGAPSVDASINIARKAFRGRSQPSARSAPQTEEAIELGLAFLARQQQQDGSWTLHGIPQDRVENAKRLNSDSAATGLAILAFQGAGYNHKEFKYANQIQSGINWLIENQQASGELYLDSDKYSDGVCRFYSHGIATLALAEAYGMTQDENLRQPVQRALDYITETQHRRLGGWRYRSGSESDTSVTGWMMMAMQSGKLANLETEEETWNGIRKWLKLSESTDQQFLFRYNPAALDKPETRHGRIPSPCMTAVGLLMNVYLGWDRSDPRLTNGTNYILQHLPDDTSITNRDTYYWYYATQIVRHVGGESWQKWHGRLHPLLIRSQIRGGGPSNPMSGSWDPLNPVPDRWGAQAGRLYVTAMNLLSLEVDYRLLPLHEDTVK